MQNSGEQKIAMLDEISLQDIVSFFRVAWIKLAISGLAGACLGFGSWFFWANYEAQLLLTNSEGITVVSLRSLQQTLPNLAAEMVERDRVPEGKLALYSTMSDPHWWKKALIPIYGLTKADMKEMGAELEKGSNGILFLAVNGYSHSKEGAISQARDISKFIRQGGSYQTLKALLASQSAELLTAEADIAARINSTQIELEYQEARLKSLEALAKRFPGESRSVAQVVDPKDSGAKYLPVSTQIIATNTDINNGKESLARLRDRQIQLGSLKNWLESAEPILASSYNGLKINQELLALEVKLRSQIGATDPRALVFVNTIRSTLLANEARFTWGLVEAQTISAKKRGAIKFTLVGLAAALFLMLLALVGQRVWANLKIGSAQ